MPKIKRWLTVLIGCALLATAACGQMGDLSIPVPSEDDESGEENER
jgi:predicted small lipoprotein YifL